MSNQKKGKIFIIFCILIVLTASVILLIMSRKEKEQGRGNAVVDSNVSDWDLDSTEEQKPGDIAIPGYASMVMKAGQTTQEVDMGNPAENNCYFRITLLLEDGTSLYQSDLIEPGKGLREIELTQPLEAGTYRAVIRYDCYSYDEAQEALNGAESGFTLDVRE